MPTAAKSRRRREVEAFKRRRILDAAREVFFEHGLDRATMRQIAGQAGYATGTLYSHFDNKEALYGALLEISLEKLGDAVGEQTDAYSAFRAFHDYYARNAEELDLGLYLFQGTRRVSLSPELDQTLNDRLKEVVDSLTSRLSRVRRMSHQDAHRMTVELLCFIVGCLIMAGTGRLGMLGYSGERIVLDRLQAVCT